MKLIALEGNRQRLDGGAMFGNAPKALWTRWAQPDELNRIELASRCLLLITDQGQRVLFEAGMGAFFEPSMKERFAVVEQEHVLLQELARHGLSDADIDIVVLSHLHFDHAGGILSAWQADRPLQLLFPNAQFVTSAQQWARACAPHPRDRASYIPAIVDGLRNSGRLTLIEPDNDGLLDGLVRFHLSEGHTPGLLLSEIATDQGPLLYCADLIPGIPWVHLPIVMGYDRYPEQLINEKTALLAELLQRGGRLFFTHDASHACALLARDERDRFFATPCEL